jgi:hypothetical protein
MGANAQTTVPTFTAGQVLTADQQNQSARTGVPVFADSSARDAAFGGTGEKTLAEGQLAYLEDSNIVQYYDGASWATVGPSPESGLTLVTTQTIGSAVSSVAVTSVFSATYDSYRIIVSGGAGSDYLNLQFGATTTGYYSSVAAALFANGNFDSAFVSNGASIGRVGYGQADGLHAVIDVVNPFLAKHTSARGVVVQTITGGRAGSFGGFVNNTTSYTDFTLIPVSGTLTGGTIKVYGYKN